MNAALTVQPIPDPSTEKVSILIIDDRPDKAFALEVALSELGENIVRAHSGTEGLRELLKQDFAVILLDVKMPGMDGFETAAMIRQRAKSELTPIIFVSAANDQENHISRGYSLGAVDYILAPVEPEILRAKVSVFVDLFRMTAQIRRQGEERAQRIRAEALRKEAESAQERSDFLAEASGVLGASLDIEETCTALARLSVPRLADCSVIDILRPDQTVETVATEHVNAEIAELYRAYREKYQLSPNDKAGPGSVLRTGQPDLCQKFTSEVAKKIAPGPERYADIQKLGISSYFALPLRTRERVFGLFGLLKTGGRQFTEMELNQARELAARASLALENAMLYTEAREARQEAERANRTKDQFLAMLSHELRTPLSPVLAAISLLELDETCPPETQESLRMIRRNVALEARLIDDLLDLTRISKGKLQLHLESVDAHDLLRNAIQICEPEVQQKRLRVVLELEAANPRLQADSARVQQVFWNLLKNAVKFTPAEGNIRIHTFNDHDGHFHLEVTDTGVGISEEELPRIFDAFEQGASNHKGGLGLGLAISKALIDMHQGTIGAHSTGSGQGSRFEVTFPSSSSATPARETGPTPAASPSREHQGSRLLLVEDHRDTLNVMARLLRRIGYEVHTADSVESALAVAIAHEFDILISDMGLPDGTGIDLMAGLRKNPGRDGFKGIALSGYGMEEDLRRTKAAGFYDHLTKPVDISKLDEVIQRLVTLEPAE